MMNKNFLLICFTCSLMLSAPLTTHGNTARENSKTGKKEEIKILFIGDSLTFFNNMPQMLETMARQAGKDVSVTDVSIGGARISRHLGSGSTLNEIARLPWDYVVIQQASARVAFADLRKDYIPEIDKLVKRVKAGHKDTKILFFMDISMKNGLHWYGRYYSYKDSQELLCRGTLEICKALDLAVAPVGRAWLNTVETHPGVELYHPDRGHPSYAGSYLQACVYFAAIFKESPLKNPYTGDLDAKTASLLQKIAADTVLNDLEKWNLLPD